MEIKSYRDQLIHSLVITTYTGYKIHCKGDVIKAVQYPVVIPKDIPKKVTDTRRKRFLTEETSKFDSSSYILTAISDGKEEVQDFKIEYYPSQSYATIDEFMKRHLTSYHDFHEDIIHVLKGLNFKKV